ncbi:MAG: hypothetical protein ACRDP4_10835, partial [Nocardioidaceae bacterium]
RPGWLHVGLAALLLVLTAVVQSLLASLGDDTDAWFGAMHALNALVIFGLAGWLAGNTRRGGPGATSR